MHKGYEALKDLPNDKKAEEANKLAIEMANKLKDVMGIDEDIRVIVSFTDEPKGDELGAYERKDAKETGVINIFINVKDVDVSDMEQVYNALGYEMNHYNPSNPYVYNKTEEQAGQNNKMEEFFTLIGRKSLDGSGNSFYNDILSGSNVLDTGNSKYYSIDEKMLDFKHSGGVDATDDYLNLKIDQCLGKKKCIKKVVADATATEKGITSYVNETLVEKGNKPKKSVEFILDLPKILEESNYEKLEDGSIALKESEVTKLNNLEAGKMVYNQVKNTDYLTKGAPSYELTEEDKVNMADMGLSLMITGHPAAVVGGAFLVLPKGLDYLYGAASDFRKGDIEGGIINSAGFISLFTVTSIAAYNSSGNTIKNNTNTSKGMTPNEYYNIKYNVSGLDDKSASIINKNYGTNYVANKLELNTKNYTYNMNENPGVLSNLENIDKLRDQPISNFYNGQYNIKILENDTYLYRGGENGGLTIPGSRNGLGQWFTTEPPSSVAKVRIDSAVKPQWFDEFGGLSAKSPVDTTYQVKIPKGTTIYYGPVGPQGGVYLGGPENIQIFINQPWKIPGVEVIKETPLK